MDITKTYIACVKAAKAKQKAGPSDILSKSKVSKADQKTINYKAKELARNITKLRSFLLKHQTEYLGEFSHLISISSKMSEEERDQIDADAQTYIKSCSNTIHSLKVDVSATKEECQSKSHYNCVLDLLQLYLKDVCKLYSQQRAYRVKQTVDRKRMSKLKPDKKIVKNPASDLSEKERTKLKDVTLKNGSASKPTQKVNSTIILNKLLVEENKPTEQFQFTPEETQMFEEENEKLFDELNNVVKEIKNIEGKVIEIGQLQEIFQEKVLTQASQIEGIYDTSVTTTENVKQGNEQIREAIKNKASFRVWVLFFLVMCTFSLLFLDWYNL